MTDGVRGDRVRTGDVRAEGLYHLATAEEWARYQEQGSIDPPSLVAEGFVHCSWGRQVAGTVAEHFAGTARLLALRLDPSALGGAELVEEDSYGSGQAFPHAYGAITAAAVRGSTSVT